MRRPPFRFVCELLGAATLLSAAALGGCSTSRTTTRVVEVAPGRYAEAFDAARETLRDYDFTLDRVDARTGVITSEPRFSVGMANPVDPIQSTARQEIQDLMNQQDRRVRVAFARPGVEPVFEPASTPADGAVDAQGGDAIPVDGVLIDGSVLPALGEDLRTDTGALVIHVDVIIDRVHRPGQRLETSSIRQSTHFQDPDMVSRGMQPTYAVARERDDALAARLAESIRAKLDGAK